MTDEPTTVTDPLVTNPFVKSLLAQPCRLCGGGERLHFPDVDVSPRFEVPTRLGDTAQDTPAPYRFEIVVCRTCMQVDWFVPMTPNGFNLTVLSATREHTVHRQPGTKGAYR